MLKNLSKKIKKNYLVINAIRKFRIQKNHLFRFLNFHIIKYISPSSKYLGSPKHELWTWKDVEDYVEQKQHTALRPFIKKLYVQQITLPLPQLTIGTSTPAAALEQKKNVYSCEYVCMFPNARLYNKDFCLITEDDYFIQPLSNYYGQNSYAHILYNKIKLPPVKKLPGKTLFLKGGNGYYHIIHDSVCAFKLIEEAGIDINTIDQFLVYDYHDSWYNTAFAKLGLPKHKFIKGDTKKAYECEQLFITTYFEHHGKWYSDYLKKIFAQQPLKSKYGDKIFVSRAKTTKRRIINEDEIVSNLKQKGFSIVFAEDLSIEEQAAIYQNAKCIVSAHGANLLNILFCEPGTKVCEIRYVNHTSYHKKTYYEIAMNCSLKYYLLYCAEGSLPLQGDETESDVLVNMRDLNKILLQMDC